MNNTTIKPMKITIRGARTQEEAQRACSAAWDFHDRGEVTTHVGHDAATATTWLFQLSKKGNVVATRHAPKSAATKEPTQ